MAHDSTITSQADLEVLIRLLSPHDLLCSNPGARQLRLDHVILDVNGTLTNRGALLADVEERLDPLRDAVDIHLVSADTFGTLDAIAQRLKVGGSERAPARTRLRRSTPLAPTAAR